MNDVSVTEAREGFAGLLNRVTYGRDRVRITRRGKPLAVLIPAEDLELLEALEDADDLRELREAAAQDDGERVTLEALRAELGS